MLMLHSLKELKLHDCQLRDGAHPKDIFVNSSSISLSSVDLSFNYLTLDTLDWLFNIKSLVQIDVFWNQLDGLIPDSIKDLTLLEWLNLSYNKLKGRIPKSLWDLSHLKVLFLSYTDLTLPDGNFSCKALESLYFSGNQLSGLVPDFSSCITLRELSLQSNKLKHLPASFPKLTNLESLYISNNSLQGTVSKATFMNLHNLKYLDLSSNRALQISPDWNPPFRLSTLNLRFVKLGPQFPTWIQAQWNLSVLDISYTSISDIAPNWLWNVSTKLYWLEMSNNKISGTIPDTYSRSLRVLDVSSNVFSDPLPQFHSDFLVLQLSKNEFSGLSIAFVCKMHELFLLDISYNNFSGELPDCWEKMTNLRDLNFGGNNFSGKIPTSIGSLQFLESLHLNDNFLSGELPSSLRDCQNLYLFDVGDNMLTGKIPKWIGSNYTSLMILVLHQNRFHGNIPQEICNLTQIQVLDLSRNNLSGKVPRCLNSFTQLVQVGNTSTALRISVNSSLDDIGHVSVQWKGNVSEYRNTLGILKLIDLSSNKLTGSIPQELFDLKGLISLNLSRNSFEGRIPQNIGQMEMLESVDLSRNILCGAIPVSLAQLHFLQVLDLSHNVFSGKIPTSTQLQSFNESIYIGNAQLCGRPLPLCPGDDLSVPNSNPKENDKVMMNWFMNLSMIQDLCISMMFGFIFGFWGVIGNLLLKKSWRITYFNFLDGIGDWMYVKVTIFLTKFQSH